LKPLTMAMAWLGAVALGALATQNFFSEKRQKENQEELWSIAKFGGSRERVLRIVTEKNVCINVKNKEGDTPLLLAIRRAHREVAELLVASNKSDVNLDCHKQTPLHLACQKGYMNLVRLLIYHGADVNAITNPRRETPLYLACTSLHADVVLCLLESHANANTNHMDVYGWDPGYVSSYTRTLLHTVLERSQDERSLKIVKLLVCLGRADLYATDDKGNTPFHKACQVSLEAVEWLYQQYPPQKAITHSRNQAGATPLHMSVQREKIEIAKFLVQVGKADIQATDKSGETVLHYWASGCSTSSENFIKWIIHEAKVNANVRNNEGNTPLHSAVLSRIAGKVRRLTQQTSLDVNMKNNAGETPLIAAVRNSREESYAGWEEDYHVVLALVENDRVDVNCRDKDKKTALHHATKRKDLVELLLQSRNINVKSRDKYGDTPLHKATYAQMVEAVRFLAHEPKTDLNLQNYSGDTPLHVACRRKNLSLIETLVQTGKVSKSQQLSNKAGDLPIHILCRFRPHQPRIGRRRSRRVESCDDLLNLLQTLMAGVPINVNRSDSHGDTPVHMVCRSGRLDMLKCLAENARPRIDVNAVIDENKNTPLHLACRAGDLDTLTSLIRFGKPYTNALNSVRNTPLHEACAMGRQVIAQCLLRHGNTKPDIPNKDGDMPLMIACQRTSEASLDFVFWLIREGGGLQEIIASRRPLNLPPSSCVADEKDGNHRQKKRNEQRNTMARTATRNFRKKRK